MDDIVVGAVDRRETRRELADQSARFPLSPYQRDIWVASMQFPSLDQYTIFIYDRYSGQIDEQALHSALTRVANRTDIFQIRLGDADGIPYQWVAAERTAEIEIVDLRGADEAKAVEAWLDHAFSYNYDLNGSTLAHLAIIRTSDSIYAYIRTHHILADAWGLQHFLRQVRSEYLRTVGADAPELISQPFISQVIADSYLSTAQHRADKAHFAEMLEGVEPALFNRKRPSGNRETARHTLLLERSLLDQIRNIGHSPFVLVSAAVALYLAKVHQTNEVVLGIPLLNRGDFLSKHTVGHFANTLPLRITIDPEQEPTEFLKRLRDVASSLLRHQKIPLGEIVRGADQLFDSIHPRRAAGFWAPRVVTSVHGDR